MEWSARFSWIASMALEIVYHNGCIEQDMSHCGHVLQDHGDSERPDDLQRCVEVAVLWQCDEVLGTCVSKGTSSYCSILKLTLS
jgi:hypothetical protein